MVAFGLDAVSLDAQVAAGVAPDYGTFWVGPWTLNSGWGTPGAEMDAMRAAGVTPAIHFYYWGDDISQSCLANGCWSSLHRSQKDMEGWYRLADELVVELHEHMEGERVLLFLETEFNKGDLQTHEPLDEALAAVAERLRAGYPAAEVVLSLGNWNRAAWTTWDRAAAASDHVGIQGMRGSTHETREEFLTLYDETLAGARELNDLFGRPVVLLDIALSSYPEPEYLQLQADALARFFDGLPELRAAGVHMILMRSWFDDTGMNLDNYYGEAERHWGLVNPKTGVAKPAADVWIKGVQSERARNDASPAASPGPTHDRDGGTMDVATFDATTTGAALRDVDAFSAAAWALWTNGHVEHAFELDAGTYDVAVRARGTSLEGQPALMHGTLNGEEIFSAEASASYTTVRAVVAVDGPAVLRIAFTNDAMSASEDRNLVLDQVVWTPTLQTPQAAAHEGVADASDGELRVTEVDTRDEALDTGGDDVPIEARSAWPADDRALVLLTSAVWAGAIAFFGACVYLARARHAF